MWVELEHCRIYYQGKFIDVIKGFCVTGENILSVETKGLHGGRSIYVARKLGV